MSPGELGGRGKQRPGGSVREGALALIADVFDEPGQVLEKELGHLPRTGRYQGQRDPPRIIDTPMISEGRHRCEQLVATQPITAWAGLRKSHR
jgi:hypothetical protein